MGSINHRTKHVFVDRHEAGAAQRNFTFDEATLVAVLIETLVQRHSPSPRTFSVRAALHQIASMGADEMTKPEKYLRPMLALLQSMVNAGLLSEVTPTSKIGGLTSEEREFAIGSTLTLEEWSRSTAAISLGLPYSAHVYGDVAVRVHQGREVEAPIASGVVIDQDWIITNKHVVESADKIFVSWGSSDLIEAKDVILSQAGLDLAAIHVPGLQAYPTVWFRQPRSSEPVVVLAYPEIPQIATRPVLRFNGWIATDEPLTTYFGDRQIVVSAVMGPGASGGPIFAADGCLVAMVVQTLEGKRQAEDGRVAQSTFHAALPADLLLDDLRQMDKRLSLLNLWASEAERAAIE